MEVGVGVLRHVVVEDDVDALNVHASAKQVGGHQDAPLEVLELLVAREPVGGSHASVNRAQQLTWTRGVGRKTWLTGIGLFDICEK